MIQVLTQTARALTGLIKRTTLALALSTSLVGSFVLSAVAPLDAAPRIGTSAAVRGDVFVTTAGAQRKTQVRDAISLEDRVLTKDDSALQILLLDRSTFTVGQNCEMVIDRFVYDPDTSAGKISARVTKGAFRFMSGNIGKNNPTDATVSTPAATIGIRGTFFEGIVGEDAIALAQLGGLGTAGANIDEASIIVLRGPGLGRNTLDEGGQITVTSGGRTATVSQSNYAVFSPGNGQPPVGPFLLTSAMEDYLNFFLRSQPNGDPDAPIALDAGGEEESGQDQFELPVDSTDDVVADVVDGLTDPNVEVEEPCDGEIIDGECYPFSY